MARSDDAVLYWEARARALEEHLDALRSRLVALTVALPPEALGLLEMDREALEAAIWSQSPVSGIENTHTFVPSDVETELGIVWQRLKR